jgi:hypothetical protein
MKPKPKLKTKFCWQCGKKLYGKHVKKLFYIPNKAEINLHVCCATRLLKDESTNFTEVSV